MQFFHLILVELIENDKMTELGFECFAALARLVIFCTTINRLSKGMILSFERLHLLP